MRVVGPPLESSGHGRLAGRWAGPLYSVQSEEGRAREGRPPGPLRLFCHIGTRPSGVGRGVDGGRVGGSEAGPETPLKSCSTDPAEGRCIS